MNFVLKRTCVCLMASGVLAFGAHGQGLDASVSHVVTGVTEHSDGTSTVTLALTIHNQSGQDLSDFQLLPLDHFALPPGDMEKTLELDTFGSGATLNQDWSIDTIWSETPDSPIYDHLLFGAEAFDAAANLYTFPINSLRGAQ
ncbi:hypothetical protein [Acinetobacter venetianus]|uniref:hypothetical protein n=1 Tax=Acinetobacter venetianus TaxID=52133 RepID=UPI003A919F1C